MLTVAENLAATQSMIEQACRRAGRAADEVTLVAVSKRQPDEKLIAAYKAGHRDFGENYVQELNRKRGLLPPDARWHLIGHLQTNKAKHAVGADLIHTVDSSRVAKALHKAATVQERRQSILIEVNLADEASKAGVSPADVPALVAEIEMMPNLSVEGLMCIPPVGEGARYFPRLRSLREQAQGESSSKLSHLSMGMSADYAEAIGAGSTIVRVGTAIFGARDV